MNTSFCRYACGLAASLVLAVMLGGCSVIDSFKPEVIRIGDGEITIKGWLDGEKDPPAPETDDQSVYAACKPDEKSATLLEAIAAVKKMDVGELKLNVFGEKKARAMVCQGALWQIDSRIDEEPNNDFTSEKLNDRFFTAFTTSAKAALDKMTPKKREKVESVVKDDIKKLVAAADFVAKKHTPKASVKKLLDV